MNEIQDGGLWGRQAWRWEPSGVANAALTLKCFNFKEAVTVIHYQPS